MAPCPGPTGCVEKLLATSEVWGRLDRKALVLFARAQVRMHRHHTTLRTEEEWLEAISDAAKAWQRHLKGSRGPRSWGRVLTPG